MKISEKCDNLIEKVILPERKTFITSSPKNEFDIPNYRRSVEKEENFVSCLQNWIIERKKFICINI